MLARERGSNLGHYAAVDLWAPPQDCHAELTNSVCLWPAGGGGLQADLSLLECIGTNNLLSMQTSSTACGPQRDCTYVHHLKDWALTLVSWRFRAKSCLPTNCFTRTMPRLPIVRGISLGSFIYHHSYSNRVHSEIGIDYWLQRSCCGIIIAITVNRCVDFSHLVQCSILSC